MDFVVDKTITLNWGAAKNLGVDEISALQFAPSGLRGNPSLLKAILGAAFRAIAFNHRTGIAFGSDQLPNAVIIKNDPTTDRKCYINLPRAMRAVAEAFIKDIRGFEPFILGLTYGDTLVSMDGMMARFEDQAMGDDCGTERLIKLCRTAISIEDMVTDPFFEMGLKDDAFTSDVICEYRGISDATLLQMIITKAWESLDNYHKSGESYGWPPLSPKCLLIKDYFVRSTREINISDITLVKPSKPKSSTSTVDHQRDFFKMGVTIRNLRYGTNYNEYRGIIDSTMNLRMDYIDEMIGMCIGGLSDDMEPIDAALKQARVPSSFHELPQNLNGPPRDITSLVRVMKFLNDAKPRERIINCTTRLLVKKTLPVIYDDQVGDGDGIKAYISEDDGEFIPRDVKDYLVNLENDRRHGDFVRIMTRDGTSILTLARRYIIRLRGIDAPEIMKDQNHQDYAVEAREKLRTLVLKKELRLEFWLNSRNDIERDKYGRYLADVYTGTGEFIQEAMLKAGLAWHYRAYDDREYLRKLTAEAWNKQVGLFHDTNAEAPWNYRVRMKERGRICHRTHHQDELI